MRVVAGTHRGRRIAAPKGDGTRPTSDRVREAVFSSLLSMRGDLENVRVLDLYAGSGALGIEAMSRGAHSAVFVDSARSATNVIKGNLENLGMSHNATVLGVKVEAANRLVPGTEAFSLLFADPPYRISKAEVRGAIEAFEKAGWIAPDAVLVWEHSAGEKVDLPSVFAEAFTKKYGSTEVTFARYEPEEA